MIKVNFYITESQRDWQAEMAARNGLPLAEVMRDALDLYRQVLDGSLKEPIAESYRTFPEVEDDYNAIKKAMLHWYHNRETNSKRGAIERVGERVEEDGAQTRKEVVELRDRVAALEQAIVELPSLIECMLSELVEVRTK